jgi:prevent-host-death family protein
VPAEPTPTPDPVDPPRIGVRDLRNDVAAMVRRAAAGERLVVTVDGVPTAQLGPLQPPPGRVTLADLAAAGLVEPPHGRAAPPPPPPEDLPVDVRLERVIEELRGR